MKNKQRDNAIKYLQEQKEKHGTPSIFSDYCDIAIDCITKIQKLEKGKEHKEQRRLDIRGEVDYITKLYAGELFSKEIIIELPDNCELRTVDGENGKYRIVVAL